ncbi:DUF134 domain-containing protein [Halarsenatibacter silvermanii]|uniref:UPF0251 protein SAMN04488692_12614 n=1 Tax=Halarsenatibacter silvermanii TaxID=321763 RepID=A0A1G9S6E3_9FIRM|nr:DUF134 domain-containing protein [Halarsenatibacter silvermanii]SDM30961.1 Predicted DNA-binding protein, UPF0251 family [Halarsenatibacter silvermanii]
MVRPRKDRKIENIPESKFYKPAGVPNHRLENVSLLLEEVEALRLKDKEGLNQEEAAERMEVSRPTFQRILAEARKKVTEALIEGKSLKFEGGNYKYQPRCGQCGRKLSEKAGEGPQQGRKICSDCL